MGWSATIISDKEITITEVEKIVKELPQNLVSGILRQDIVPFNGWGWRAATDIILPRGNKLTISGSYTISGDKAEPMADFLKSKLEEYGHNISVKFNW